MSNKSSIVSYFNNNYQSARETKSSLVNQQFEELDSYIYSHFTKSYTEMRAKLFDKRDFFHDFDYCWIDEEENYASFIEKFIQILLVDTMAEVSKNHKNYSYFSQVCFRISRVSNKIINVLYENDTMYICVSPEMVLYLQSFINGCIELGEVAGVDISEKITFAEIWVKTESIRRTNKKTIISPHIIESAFFHSLRSENISIPPYLLDNIECSVHSLKIHDTVSDYCELLIATTLSFVIQEIMIFIEERTSINTEINLAEESDIGFSSLYLITCSRFNNISSSYSVSPSIMFGMLRHSIAAEIISKLLNYPLYKGQSSQSDKLEKIKELDHRTSAYCRTYTIHKLSPNLLKLYTLSLKYMKFISDATLGYFSRV